MKLLCWMHRKFRQNSHEALKALVIGQSSVDDQQYFPKPSYGAPRSFKHGGGGQRPDHGQLRKSFTCLEATMDDDVADYYDDESSSVVSELFHGFLAIGTLGSSPEAVNAAEEADPAATPTFAISVVEDIIAAADQRETETDLKLINDELEKVLSSDDAFFNDASSMASRSSHVSNGRSSHGSVITLSGGKPDLESSGGGGGGGVFPLQGYLFGSAIELSETAAVAAAPGRRSSFAASATNYGNNSIKESGGGGGGGNNRMSLGELFQRSKAAEDSGGVREDKRFAAEKEAAERSAVNMMKKKIKKKMLHASSRNSAAGNTSAPTEKKLNKILHMFHRKVHPESSTVGVGKSGKAQKKKTGHENGIISSSSNYQGQTGPDEEDIILCPERALFLKQKLRRYRSQSNPPHLAFAAIDSFANREQWIRTDADYLVLEL